MYLKQGEHFIGVGRLPRDAVYKTVGSRASSLCKFSVQVDAGQNQAKWINCVCWHALARYAAGLEKNDVVLVCGKLQDASYEKNGQKIPHTELVCELVLPQPSAAYAQADAAIDDAPQEDFHETGEEMDVPF